MQFLLHISAFNEDPLKVYERLVASGSLDGFVVLDPIADDPRIALLQARKVPFVLHGRMEQKPGHPLHDNDAVGFGLARSLLTAAHRRIAFLNGQPGRTYADVRRAGFLRACGEMGVSVDHIRLLHGDMTEGYGLIEAARLWSAEAPHRNRK
jgi:LacI family transcriptional regulator